MRILFDILSGRATAALDDASWRSLLDFADRTQLTLYLRGNSALPEWMAREVETRYVRNAERRLRLRVDLEQVSSAFAADGIEFVLLKGFTHAAAFGLDGSMRVQYDLDVLTQPSDVARARAALCGVGYAPHGSRSLSDEHSLPMVQPSDWVWRRDYYDPSMPIPVEVHGTPWSPERDRIQPEGVDRFWERRGPVRIDGLQIPSFAAEDVLAFAALHTLRHILRQDARPAHVLELGRMVEACPSSFWDGWREAHAPGLRALQTVGFRFAREWFGCMWPGALEEEWARLPRSITAWFERLAWSPVENLSRPEKATVWLHLALIQNASSWDRWRLFAERMLPLRLPHAEEEGPYGGRLLDRLRYHAAALAPALASGLRWRRAAHSTASQTSAWKRRSV
jgi:hypothetical protein